LRGPAISSVDFVTHLLALPAGVYVFAAIGGVVRGFTGFGAALTFVPITASLIGPQFAVATIVVLDTVWQSVMWRDAWRNADRRAMLPLIAGALVGAPLGIHVLVTMDPTVLRWGMSLTVLAAVGLLASGWRLARPLGQGGSVVVGAVSGFFNGAATMGGLIAATFWLAGRGTSEAIRASLVLYLIFLTVYAIFNLSFVGVITPERVVSALPLLPAYGLGMGLGILLFRRAGSATYRPIAYCVITLGAILASPVFDRLLRG
jgi:hypothetical protein